MGFPYKESCHLQREREFDFFIANLDAFFFSLSCPIAVARTSNTMLNKSVESGHPCCVPDLKKAVIFFPLRMVFDVGLS